MSKGIKELVLATGNPGKVAELQAMLAPYGYRVRPQVEYSVAEVAETGLTFVENALLKARHAAEITGLPALADDSGLCVDYLQGAPGLYSSRYAGEQASDADNVGKLLAALAGVPEAERGAHFHCSIVFLRTANDPDPVISSARWRGVIAETTAGQQGFGYDPVFYVPEQACTAAQLSKASKNSISHRGQALSLLAQQLTGLPDFGTDSPLK